MFKRRFLSLFLALSLIFSMGVSSYAISVPIHNNILPYLVSDGSGGYCLPLDFTKANSTYDENAKMILRELLIEDCENPDKTVLIRLNAFSTQLQPWIMSFDRKGIVPTSGDPLKFYLPNLKYVTFDIYPDGTLKGFRSIRSSGWYSFGSNAQSPITFLTPCPELNISAIAVVNAPISLTENAFPKHNLSVRYVDRLGEDISPSITRTVTAGVLYNIPSPTIDGYTPDKSTISGTMGNADITETVIYTRNSHTMTVNYQHEDGTQAAEPVTQSIESGAAYSIPSPTIEGHTPDKATVSGTMGDTDRTETVTYSTVAPERVTIAVNYEYADGTTAAPSFSDSFIVGTPYQIASPSIPGYAPDRAHVSGTVPSEDLTVTVVYSPGSYSLTVNYLFEDGSSAAPSYQGAYSASDEYRIESPLISGYLPNYHTVSGSMPSRDLTLSVTYSIDYSGGGSSEGGGESSESPENPFDPPDDSLGGMFGDYEFHDPFSYHGSGGGSSGSGFDFDSFFSSLLGGYQFTNPFDIK